MSYTSTKIIELGSCAFRQWRATHSHCSTIHGYQLNAKFWFKCEELDDKNWCVDFGGLKDLKDILQKQFDHTLTVAKDDPLLPLFQELHNKGGCDLRIMDSVGIEKVSEYCFKEAEKLIKKKYKNRCWVEKVEVWEHDRNSAVYEPTKAVSKNIIKQTAIKDIVPQEVDLEQLVENTPVVQNTTNERAANVGNKTTEGWSNPFAGTSWGS